MWFQRVQRVLLALGIICTTGLSALAQDNPPCVSGPNILVHSCQGAVDVRLDILPNGTAKSNNHLLTVTGAYSSADRFGIEGLVIQGGKMVSRRYKNWDGVLLVDANGKPEVFHASAVRIADITYNLKDKSDRDAFVPKAQEAGLAVIQSHLLITNGKLDLEDIDGAPRFIRRLFVQQVDGSFGIWETAMPETLYDAALLVQEELNPQMAFNLDMGAYNYCISGPVEAQKDCGQLLASKDSLTNVLIFSKAALN